MANFKTHAFAGAAAGRGVTIWEHRKIKEKDPNAELDIWKLLINVCAGIAGAILPDKFEPALNPNHRAFFHSLTSGGGVAYSIKKVATEPASIHSDLRYPAFAFLLGYCSHLVLDGTTPKGLPLIF